MESLQWTVCLRSRDNTQEVPALHGFPPRPKDFDPAQSYCQLKGIYSSIYPSIHPYLSSTPPPTTISLYSILSNYLFMCLSNVVLYYGSSKEKHPKKLQTFQCILICKHGTPLYNQSCGSESVFYTRSVPVWSSRFKIPPKSNILVGKCSSIK